MKLLREWTDSLMHTFIRQGVFFCDEVFSNQGKMQSLLKKRSHFRLKATSETQEGMKDRALYEARHA